MSKKKKEHRTFDRDSKQRLIRKNVVKRRKVNVRKPQVRIRRGG